MLSTPTLYDSAVTHVSDAAARLDRLPVSAFHRRTAALLAYVFFFELGDLNSFAYAAPALRQQMQGGAQAAGT